jgi:hypothetical protein
MRAQDYAAIESILNRGIRRASHSECERPLGSFKVLRLYRAEPPHHINRFSKVRRRQPLVLKSLRNEICSIHLKVDLNFSYMTFCG